MVSLLFSEHLNVQVAEYRGLLTDREREVLGGEADVSQNYVYQIRHRVRRKIDRLRTDIDLLEEHHPDLAAEVRAAVREAETDEAMSK